MSDNKIIQFPTNKIINRINNKPEEVKKIKKEQLKKYVETEVDSISLQLLSHFVGMAMQTSKPEFSKDLALLVDAMRGMIYRDFGLNHPIQKMVDKMVTLKTDLKTRQPVARIDYSQVVDFKGKTKPLSDELNQEVNDLNDSNIDFEPDFEPR